MKVTKTEEFEVSEAETEFGIFCPSCHNDFWESELLPDSFKSMGYKTLAELKQWGYRA